MSLKTLSLLVTPLAALETAPVSPAANFLTGRNYPSGEYPVVAAVQDFNNDVVSDIASVNQIRSPSCSISRVRADYRPNSRLDENRRLALPNPKSTRMSGTLALDRVNLNFDCEPTAADL